MLGTREYTLCSPFRANAHNSSLKLKPSDKQDKIIMITTLSHHTFGSPATRKVPETQTRNNTTYRTTTTPRTRHPDSRQDNTITRCYYCYDTNHTMETCRNERSLYNTISRWQSCQYQSRQTNQSLIRKHSPKTDKVCNVCIMNGWNHELPNRELNQVFQKEIISCPTWYIQYQMAPVMIHLTGNQSYVTVGEQALQHMWHRSVKFRVNKVCMMTIVFTYSNLKFPWRISLPQ